MLVAIANFLLGLVGLSALFWVLALLQSWTDKDYVSCQPDEPGATYRSACWASTSVGIMGGYWVRPRTPDDPPA